jgi:hypothetical protein
MWNVHNWTEYYRHQQEWDKYERLPHRQVQNTPAAGDIGASFNINIQKVSSYTMLKRP